MADLLSQLQQSQGVSNADLAKANHDFQWNNTFASTPTVEVLRSRVNLADTINRAVDNKIALQAQSDAKALDLMHKTAQFREYQAQAPLREQLLQARVAATGATERRMAEQQRMEAEDTAKLNSGFVELLGKYKRGTPEFAAAGAELLNSTPHAAPAHIKQLGDVFGLPGETPEEKIANASKLAGATEQARIAARAASALPVEQQAANEALIAGAKAKAIADTKPVSARDVATPILERQLALHQSAFDRASQRRIQAQKAFDHAQTDDQKRANKDLIDAADADINASKSAMAEITGQLKGGAPAAPTAPSLKPIEDSVAASARAAIAAGKDAEAVKKRLQENGYDPSGL